MQKFLEILRVVLYIPFFLFTFIVIGFHVHCHFTIYLAIYDILFVLFMFIIPRTLGDKVRTDEAGMATWYLFTGGIILISLGYYIMEFVYKW